MPSVRPPVSGPSAKPLVAPERTSTQRMEALRRANVVRSRRAQLKRDLKAGRQTIHVLLLEPPEYLETARSSTCCSPFPSMGA